MPGSFDFNPEPAPLARPARQVAVFRYRPDVGVNEGRYELLPNVRVVSIDDPEEGAHPGAAQFRYAFADVNNDPGDPYRAEHVYGPEAGGQHVVQPDDRLTVAAYYENASGYDILFDGFAQVPQADLSSTGETVTFTALGTPIREWDTPLGGAILRDADDPAGGDDVETGLPARFNPGGQPNATLENADARFGEPWAHPGFLDHRIVRDPEVRRAWTLEMAVRYCLFVGNPDDINVRTPDAEAVTEFLQALEPTGGPDAAIDPADPDTYTMVPIPIEDIDVTGDPWPVAVEKLISPHGFGMTFHLNIDEAGDPDWTLVVYRKDTGLRVKSLHLQQAGGQLDPARTNVGEMSLARDTAGVVNRIVVDTAPVRHQADFVLASGFAIAVADAADANLKNWKGNEKDPVKYRHYVFDEAGDGHWDAVTAAWITGEPTSLNRVLGEPEEQIEDAEEAEERPPIRQYATRRRPVASNHLITMDATTGEPIAAELWLSADYEGPVPGVWDTTGTWQRVTSGGWKLLDDRLGIELTAADLENWSIGNPNAAGMPFGTGKVRVVKCQADPMPAISPNPSPAPRFYFRLTAVIEADFGLDAVAGRRDASPTTFTISRRDDVRERFRKEVVSKWCHFSDPFGEDAEDTIVRDDTETAMAHAMARRRAREAGTFSGSVTIPRITTAYRVGDQVDGILGRDISLRRNAGAEQAEGDVYPTIVGMSWNFDGRQTTTLKLSDHRADTAPARRGRKRL